jgi:predicted RNA-binding protein YlxR (DUF448 family)
VRVTTSSVGIVVDGPSSGRGAWLCRDGQDVQQRCLDNALSRRAFARAWRVEVSADDERAIRERIGLRTDNGDESDAQ